MRSTVPERFRAFRATTRSVRSFAFRFSDMDGKLPVGPGRVNAIERSEAQRSPMLSKSGPIHPWGRPQGVPILETSLARLTPFPAI